jgi:enolase-phosphatase E1
VTIPFTGTAILLDVEGTTSSIGFVYDILFPYAARNMAGFLGRRWNDPAVRKACDLIVKDGSQEAVLVEVERLMHADAKQTGLKALQGFIWEEGYASGELRSHVYPDVRPALEAWTKRGLEVRIYSSGSIAAQKAFFGKTEAGDLLPFFAGHYDTTTGGKRESASYVKIAADMKRPPGEILFISDVDGELYAAQAAGFQVVLSDRPGNPPADFEPQITSFAEIG